MKRIGNFKYRVLEALLNISRHEARQLSRRAGFVSPETEFSDVDALIKSLAPLTCDGMRLTRLGPDTDGGYLVPDDLDDIEAVFSPGVGRASGFEADCANRGMKVFMADNSVEGPAEHHPAFQFQRKHIGASPSETHMTLHDWVVESLPSDSTDLLLQLDTINEYEILLNVPDPVKDRFRIIVVEFHRLDHFWSQPFFEIAQATFARVLSKHACVHIHPNNCCGMVERHGLSIPRVAEFTFLRRDRFQNAQYATTFPHPLDRDCSDKESLRLPNSWIGRGPLPVI